MNVLSLFDGMSCGQIAFNKLGIQVDNYYASEIDKYAIKVTQENFPNTIQLGDVKNWQDWDLDWSSISYVSGGFPCQSWSLAGKQLGDKDPRGDLFWTMLDIMKKVLTENPKAIYFMENVKMKKEFEDYITYHTQQALPSVNKYLINSALVSAQNRRRFYWTNLLNVEQPEDKGIVLKDILEDLPDKFTLMSSKFVNRNADKNCLIDKTKNKASNLSAMEYIKNGRQGDYLACNKNGSPAEVLGGAIRGRYKADGSTEQQLEINGLEKANSLTTVQKDSLIVSTKPNQINPSKKASGRQPYMQDRVFHVQGKSHALTREFASRTKVGLSKIREKSKTVRAGGRSSYDRHEWDSVDELHYRKLSVLECKRLQTIPDDYKMSVSDSQAYKMLGNGWTVDVICHILKNLKTHFEKNEIYFLIIPPTTEVKYGS